MSENDIIEVRRRPDGTVIQILPDGRTQPLVDETDWVRVQGMSEEEIEANAQADPDNRSPKLRQIGQASCCLVPGSATTA